MQTVNAHGAEIPALGFGTFRVSEPDVLRMVPHVLRLGFRHIDTAQAYGNEAAVGEGIARSGIARDDVFLTTKVWVDNYRQPDFLRSVDAAGHGRSVPQVVLRWLVQQEGVAALSKTVREDRAAENLAIFDFALDSAEMAAIHGLAHAQGRIVSPPGLAPIWDAQEA
jgi:diketogulonate reductase-like aldo/keto reductase